MSYHDYEQLTMFKK